ncbi:glycoside hydrolase N-terminal domain-containing protein [Paenibacillus chartarius]|uniref:Glycoside hydrolase N-terminal domain-containing protein n=1 Tax=Paenibacillus chartarius TaxID=747481 RepID=A0ABV6DK26_9BACL
MSDNKLTMWYDRPAGSWFEALPIGNGRLGGMVFGGTERERIALNEDTLWSGEPRDTLNHEAAGYLDLVRTLIFEGKHADAEAVIEEHMLGPDIESYLPLGDLELVFDRAGETAEYRRELDLSEGVARVRYRLGDAYCTRELLVSAADQVMAVRLECERKFEFTAVLHSPLQFRVRLSAPGEVTLTGQAPVRVLPNTVKSDDPIEYADGRGIRFEAKLRMMAEHGRVEASGGRIRFSGAGPVTLLLAAATSFGGFRVDPSASGADPGVVCSDRLAQAAALGYERIKARHVQEYRSLFGRSTFELGGAGPGIAANRSMLPTDIRLQALREGAEDPGLIALFYQYGRYLLLSSSRPGTQPANLQGIWNDKMRPPWCSSWTTNINVEMNYWPAELTNLAECHRPLFDFIEDLRITGKDVASVHYGCRGWAAHHNIDLWRTATPASGSASWAFWPMAGAWLCRHLWEHYAFTQDEQFLRQAYPAMSEAALFCLDWLVEAPNGGLVTCPSTSPENSFIAPDGRSSSVTQSATLDTALIRDLFANCLEAARILGIGDALAERIEAALERLPPYRIGAYGQLQEWDDDFEEREPGHRHTAHLTALHPLDQITLRGEPKLAAACRTALERRLANGGAHTGWSCAWMINFWARLSQPQQAARYLRELLAGAHPNLMNAHRHPKVQQDIFQIDGNLAGVSGIVEMLLQSHGGELQLLPSLPPQWVRGKITGLRARGAFEVDIEWEEGKLLRARIRSEAGKPCRLRTQRPVRVHGGTAVVIQSSPESHLIAFGTEAGQIYDIVPRSRITDEIHETR